MLSARDLQREDKGTWLGITQGGQLGILTNYLQTDNEDFHPDPDKRSRGSVTNEWLGYDSNQSITESLRTFLDTPCLKEVGGFSIIVGRLKLRSNDVDDTSARAMEPPAVISSQSKHLDDVQWIAGGRGEFYGLSNALYGAS